MWQFFSESVRNLALERIIEEGHSIFNLNSYTLASSGELLKTANIGPHS